MDVMEKIVNLCKRRGFVYPGSEIYGGLANTWDYGPLGVELLNNIKRLWWKTFVHQRSDMVGIDAGILMNARVWEASGHVSSFHDAMIDCKQCKSRIRADHLIEDNVDVKVEGKTLEEMNEIITKHQLKCPVCASNQLTQARYFNLLFKTNIGVVQDSSSIVYLRGETAQGIFVNFKNVLNSTRKKIPFGIAQIGKAFRNEITPGNFIFRTLEFEQMEIEYFIDPQDDWQAHFERWQKEMDTWMSLIGISKDKYRWREHDKEELSHYSKRTADIEFHFPFGTKELYGLAYRTDFDLSAHQKSSGQDLQYFDQETKRKFIAHVLEPTFGVTRTFLAVLLNSYKEEEVATAKEGEMETRIVLQLPKALAPIKIGILPLMKKPELTQIAKEIYDELKQVYTCEYDETQSIGKRYRRQDEIGTPYCVTIDYDTKEKGIVTVRERDTMQQHQIHKDELHSYFTAQFNP